MPVYSNAEYLHESLPWPHGQVVVSIHILQTFQTPS